MRYKLVPATRDDDANQWRTTWHAHSIDQAHAAATQYHEETGAAILICEAPLGGIVRHIQTIGGTKRTRRQAR